MEKKPKTLLFHSDVESCYWF